MRHVITPENLVPEIVGEPCTRSQDVDCLGHDGIDVNRQDLRTFQCAGQHVWSA